MPALSQYEGGSDRHDQDSPLSSPSRLLALPVPLLLPSVPTHPQAASEEEREHAEQLMEYQNVRGGRVRLASMLQPETEFNHADKVRVNRGAREFGFLRAAGLPVQ